MTRYCYHNRAYISSGAAHGIYCDPVKRNGKCILGRGNQLVKFENGVICTVVRRALRLRQKCDKHPSYILKAGGLYE